MAGGVFLMVGEGVTAYKLSEGLSRCLIFRHAKDCRDLSLFFPVCRGGGAREAVPGLYGMLGCGFAGESKGGGTVWRITDTGEFGRSEDIMAPPG